MEILIFIIFIIIAVSKASSKDKPAQTLSKQEEYEIDHNDYARSSNQRAAYQNPTPRTSSAESERWKKVAQENIQKAKQRASAIATEVMKELEIEDGVKSPEHKDMLAAERIHTRRTEERKTTILQRAKGNASEKKEDVTLNTMEAEHNHSERVSAATHHHPEDEIPENMLGTIDDLMIKGYDGNLCFERDFVGEAMDMISRFTVPSEVPEFSSKDAS